MHLPGEALPFTRDMGGPRLLQHLGYSTSLTVLQPKRSWTVGAVSYTVLCVTQPLIHNTCLVMSYLNDERLGKQMKSVGWRKVP